MGIDWIDPRIDLPGTGIDPLKTTKSIHHRFLKLFLVITPLNKDKLNNGISKYCPGVCICK